MLKFCHAHMQEAKVTPGGKEDSKGEGYKSKAERAMEKAIPEVSVGSRGAIHEVGRTMEERMRIGREMKKAGPGA